MFISGRCRDSFTFHSECALKWEELELLSKTAENKERKREIPSTSPFLGAHHRYYYFTFFLCAALPVRIIRAEQIRTDPSGGGKEEKNLKLSRKWRRHDDDDAETWVKKFSKRSIVKISSQMRHFTLLTRRRCRVRGFHFGIIQIVE